MRIVFDASALLEGLDPAAPGAAPVTALREKLAGFSVGAPGLLLWELGNRIVRAIGAKGIPDEPTATGAMQNFLEDVRLDSPSAGAIERTLRLARKHALTFYDASYLELSLRDPEGVLITEDADLLRAGLAELGKHRCFTIQTASVAFTA